MELLIQVYVKFIHKHNAEPVHGGNYSARLYDKDILTDDFLGESKLNSEGKAHFKIDPKQYRTEDSLLETKPDFYITLLKEGLQIFKTPVAQNIDFNIQGNFNSKEGEWIDLGTFVIE
ncbi:MAG: hypothetical protein H7Y00_03570 [Fimbriimonadaceae bacterium]|nr:hypothetical protein [Chitinophagales bacterium]